MKRQGLAGTMRHAKSASLVTGKEIEARMFGSRREAKDCCADHCPGSPVKEIGRGAAKPPTRKPGPAPLIRLEQRGAAGFAFMWQS